MPKYHNMNDTKHCKLCTINFISGDEYYIKKKITKKWIFFKNIDKIILCPECYMNRLCIYCKQIKDDNNICDECNK